MFRAFGVAAIDIGTIVVLAATLEGAVAAGESAGKSERAALPRYRLEVGQQLAYEMTSSQKYQGGEFKSATDWRFWVASARQEGGWRLLVSTMSWHASGDRPIAKEAGAARTELAYFDLLPDGRIIGNPSLGPQLDVRAVFPRLPNSEPELTAGWTADGAMDDLHHYKAEANEEGGVRFSDDKTSPANAIYLINWKTTYHFAADRGLIDGAEIAYSQQYGFKGEGGGELKLAGVQTLSSEAIATLAGEIKTYFDAIDDYRNRLKQALKESEKFEQLYHEAKNRLRQAASRLTSLELKTQAESQLSRHDALASYYQDEARRRAEAIGKEAAPFETTDLDGRPCSLADFRGKVVVLDFWYRGCGWCIRAMPQINEIAHVFRDKPVAVIGMNTDRDVEDAKFVVEKMGLKYANVKAEGLPEKFKVRGFPTLVVVDQKGVVREMHVGYSPTLAAELSETINALLAEK